MNDQFNHLYDEDIVETIREPVLVLSSDLTVLFANSCFHDIFKVPSGKIIGLSVYDIGNQQWNIPEFRILLEKILKKENKIDIYEVEHVFPDIGHKIILINARSISHKENGSPLIILTMEDVTKYRLLENLLEESEDRYMHIYETATDGILLLRKSDGSIIYTNRAAKVILGYSKKDYIEKKLPDIGFPDDKCDIQEILRILERGNIIYYNDASIKNKYGQTINVDMHMINNARFIQCNIRDITRRKQTEENTKQNFLLSRESMEATVHAISYLVETRDPYMAGHQSRVADLAGAIAAEMGLTTGRLKGIRMAAGIHDIGKMSIPVDILSRPMKLTDIELGFVKTHAQSGHDILKDIKYPWPVARMVIEHHERINGSGYPNGLRGNDVLLESRILAVADVIAAMVSHRSYRPPLGIDAALDEITQKKGLLYDPEVVDACLKIFQTNNYKIGN